MKKSHQVAALLSCFLLLVVLFNGCALAPTPVEQHFYGVTTNTVPIVTVETVTNAAGQPVVMVATNFAVTYTYTSNTNQGAMVVTARNIGNLFGPYGELAGAALVGAFGVWGAIRSRKATQYVNATGALAQTIEVFREVLKTTPKGQELNDKLTSMMINNQVTVGVIREVAKVVSTQVDNVEAKRAADVVLNSLPATP